MNFTESFQEFSSKLGPMDLALYAGVGIVVWVLFKDKLSPAQKIVMDFISGMTKSTAKPVANKPGINTDVVDTTTPHPDSFFDLVASWKQTRDLAVLNGCSKAVEVADQMFPYLSPSICQEKKDVKETTE